MERIITIDVGFKRIGIAYTPNKSVVVPFNVIIRKKQKSNSKRN
jgi:putative Holliday junction resolvase